MKSVTVFVKWLFSFMGAIAAGLAVYWITLPAQEPPPDNPCIPLPGYLEKLRCMPPSFPGATKNIKITFEARGPDDKGAITSYFWTYNDRSAQGRNATFRLTERGDNKVSVKATDINQCTVTKHCVIKVQ